MQRLWAPFLSVFLIVCVVIALVWLTSGTAEAPIEEEVTTTPTAPTAQWQWVFNPAGTDASTTAPRTNVVLRNGDTSYAIGTFTGNCFDMTQSDWKLAVEEGEFAGAICWWAGGGNEIGVFSDEGTAVVRVGDVDEGSAEEPGTRGNFRDLFTIDFGFIRGVGTSTPGFILFDDARWLMGKPGEDAAIAAGLCTEKTRSECLPNDFYILNQNKTTVKLLFAPNIAVYMLTWNAGEMGIKRQFIKSVDFAALINDAAQHWNTLPYNVSTKNGEVIMIEEVYVP